MVCRLVSYHCLGKLPTVGSNGMGGGGDYTVIDCGSLSCLVVAILEGFQQSEHCG